MCNNFFNIFKSKHIIILAFVLLLNMKFQLNIPEMKRLTKLLKKQEVL